MQPHIPGLSYFTGPSKQFAQFPHYGDAMLGARWRRATTTPSSPRPARPAGGSYG